MSGTILGASYTAENETDKNVFLCGASCGVESGDDTDNITYSRRW